MRKDSLGNDQAGRPWLEGFVGGVGGGLVVDFVAELVEYLGGKGLDGRRFLPGVEWQAGLVAGLGEEGIAVPGVFDGNLREQQAAPFAIGDQQAVAPDFNFGWSDRKKGREHAERKLEIGGLFGSNRPETGVFKGGGAGGFGDGAIERADWQGVANAAAELAIEINGGKDSARLSETLQK